MFEEILHQRSADISPFINESDKSDIHNQDQEASSIPNPFLTSQFKAENELETNIRVDTRRCTSSKLSLSHSGEDARD